METQDFRDYLRGWKVVVAALDECNNQVCHGGITLPSTVKKAIKWMEKFKHDLGKSDVPKADQKEITAEIDELINHATENLPTDTKDKPCQVEAGVCFIGPEGCVAMGALGLIKHIEDKKAKAAQAAAPSQEAMAACGSACGSERASVVPNPGGAKKVLLAVPDGSEDIEVAAFIEIPGWTKVLKTTPIEVTITGWDDRINCFHGLKLAPDVKIDQVNIDEYDCLAIPGGWPGTRFNEQTNSELFQNMVKRAFDQNKLIATMCFGVFPLGEAGLLKGIKATSFTSDDPCCSTCQQVKSKVIAYGTDFQQKAIVVDHNVISNIGPAVAAEAALTMVEMLIGEEQTQAIANMIMYNQVEPGELKYTRPVPKTEIVCSKSCAV